MYRLVFHNARTPFVGRKTVTVIGRDAACTLQLAEPGVSDQHAAIERRADGLFIRDLGSATGVHVNGQRVTEHRLANGDVIHLGAVRAAFEVVHEPPAGKRALDPWQPVAVGVVVLLVTGQLGLFAWIFSQEHPRRGRTDIVARGKQQQQTKPATNEVSRALAALPATESPAAPASAVLNRMVRITRVERANAADGVTLRVQVKAQVGERTLDLSAVGVSVQCETGPALWLTVPKDWDNFSSRTLSAHFAGQCPSYVVRTYYRKQLQDELVSR